MPQKDKSYIVRIIVQLEYFSVVCVVQKPQRINKNNLQKGSFWRRGFYEVFETSSPGNRVGRPGPEGQHSGFPVWLKGEPDVVTRRSGFWCRCILAKISRGVAKGHPVRIGGKARKERKETNEEKKQTTNAHDCPQDQGVMLQQTYCLRKREKQWE